MSWLQLPIPENLVIMAESHSSKAATEDWMMMRVAQSAAKHVSVAQAAALVKSGDWLDYGTSLVQPDEFDKALAARAPELSDVKIRNCLSVRARAVLEADPEGKHFHNFNWHFTGYDRKKHDAGRAHYLPLNLGEVPDYYRRFIAPVDVVVFKCCPVDENGFFNFSAANLWHRAVMERAKIVIVEVTTGNPHVYGQDNGVHISEVDYIVQGDNVAAVELPNPPPTEIDRAVARHIATEINDGDCLQIGIGGMPNAVCTLLLESGAKNLGIHTEMMTDGIGELYKAGRITGDHKQINKHKISYTFGLGSRWLYEMLGRNTDFECWPVDYTNAPHIIMQNDNVVSINNTTQVDLQGQAASESDGHRHISGTGGQLQFVRGAYASKNGKSFICLASTYDKKVERRSRIVFDLTKGNIVTTPRSDVMYVVTEFGIVNLKGKSVPERAQALISIAHPDFREELERHAYEQRIIPRGVSF
jgi:acyl-CoA hydrolase